MVIYFLVKINTFIYSNVFVIIPLPSHFVCERKLFHRAKSHHSSNVCTSKNPIFNVYKQIEVARRELLTP